MSKTRIYLVETSIGNEIVVKARQLVRAKTKHQAEQHVIRHQITSRIATQDDMEKYLPDGVVSAETIAEQTDTPDVVDPAFMPSDAEAVA
ncbi:MAG: hypothetical protein AB7Q76_04155 [Gammaproteobacteria bacterium]